jgi:predicted CXXCH cytochrome family protein
LHLPRIRRRRLLAATGVAAFLVILLAAAGSPAGRQRMAAAAHPFGGPAPLLFEGEMPSLLVGQEAPRGQSESDAACRQCHSGSEAAVVFPSGESLPVGVDLDTLAGSAHGLHADTALACTACHTAADYQIPHRPVEAPTLRAYRLEQSALCQSCHLEPHLTSHPDLAGESQVTCTDCHGAHDVLTADRWQAGEGVFACSDCHLAEGVGRFDQSQLSQMVRNGLFTRRADSDYCLACHTLPDFFLTFPNGDQLGLTIDPQALHDSVHGQSNSWQPLACTDCHEQYGFPHEPHNVQSERQYNLAKYTRCEKCHERFYERTLDSTHGTALAMGNEQAAVCTDCHGAHDTPVPDEPRSRISLTCGQCHTEIMADYQESVHGEALLLESNEDVPTCIDCHGVHNIGDPTTTLFRLRSPQLCAGCHADAELMDRYGISTNVFNTYVADFHGTTTTLFDPQDPSVKPNTAVCYDCHGVHDIKRPDDPDAGIRANLVATCRQCHPDATESFSAAWTSHYEPSLTNYPLVFLVSLFYKIVIPATVGFFGFLVVTDVYRRARHRLGGLGGHRD